MHKSDFTAAVLLTTSLLTSGCASMVNETKNEPVKTIPPIEIDPYKAHIGTNVLLSNKLYVKVMNFENSNCVKGLEERIAPDLSSIKIRNCSIGEGSLPINDGVLTGYFEQYSWDPATEADFKGLFLRYGILHQLEPDAGHDEMLKNIIEAWKNMNKLPKNNNVSQAASPAP